MNRLMQEKWAWVEGSHAMRTGLLENITDADLDFTPGGAVIPLRELLREMGEIQHSYIQSFKTLEQTWDYKHSESLATVADFSAWYASLNSDLQATLSAFSDEDLSKLITRRTDYQMPVEMQLDIYLQALLIFFGKATVYLRAMEKPLPQSIAVWIG